MFVDKLLYWNIMQKLSFRGVILTAPALPVYTFISRRQSLSLPDIVVEVAGEADPRQVGEQQQGYQPEFSKGDNDEGSHKDIESDDDSKGEAREVEAEE